MGRIWTPDAVFSDQMPADGRANLGMDIEADLAHGWTTAEDLAYHYQGPVRRVLSDDDKTYLYYVTDPEGTPYAMGTAEAKDTVWAGGMAWAGALIPLSAVTPLWVDEDSDQIAVKVYSP